LASVDIQKNNDSFVRKVSLSGMFFSYTAPAAVVYFLNSTLNTVAIGTINLAGSVATTVTETAAQANYELPLNFALPIGYRIYVTLGTGVASGWDATVIGGDY
jgi:hypothetical protein